MTKHETGPNRPVRRFAIIHNMPSPYRLHLFDVMHAVLSEEGWQLEIHFRDICRGDRAHWGNTIHGDYKYSFWPNWSFGVLMHTLNPGLLQYICRTTPEIVMLGGLWDSLTSMIGAFMFRKSLLIGWYEANYLIPGRMGRVARTVKRSLLKRLDWHALPGLYGQRFLPLILKDSASACRVAILPNIVDGLRFANAAKGRVDASEGRQRMGLPLEKLILFMPARLIPEKGIPQFLQGFKAASTTRIHLLIMGDGPKRDEVRDLICRLHLVNSVSLRSSVSYDAMPAHYTIADAFCLASVSDSNPLSVVEALHAGLPLFLSNRVGNFPETLVEGVNGHGFNPDDIQSVAFALRALDASSQESRVKMGHASRKIAIEHWDSEKAVRRFLEPILATLR